MQCDRIYSTNPVVAEGTIVDWEPIDPHPDMLKVRQRLGVDYGKIDYCMHDGVPVLLDVNKTIGMSPRNPSQDFLEYVCRISPGITDYLDQLRSGSAHQAGFASPEK